MWQGFQFRSHTIVPCDNWTFSRWVKEKTQGIHDPSFYILMIIMHHPLGHQDKKSFENKKQAFRVQAVHRSVSVPV